MSRGKDIVERKPAVVDHCKQRSKGELNKGRILTLLCSAGGDRKVQEGRCRWASVGRVPSDATKNSLVLPLDFPSFCICLFLYAYPVLIGVHPSTFGFANPILG